MRVTPVESPVPAKDKPRRGGAMIIHGNKHTVMNFAGGEKITLPPREAWALHQSLNMVDIVV